jgi:hypothetical protein
MTDAQRFALLAGGRDEIKLREQDSAWAWKMPENAAESHPSSARFVSWRFLAYFLLKNYTLTC